MAFGDVKLRPGVSADWTPTLNEAGISQSQLIRFRDQLAQKMGGWQRFLSFAVSGVPRDIHAWQDLNATNHLAVATTNSFNVITNGTLTTITPQTFLSNFAPKFTTTSGSKVVSITDLNISNVTTFDSIFFNTPISVGGIILSGLYQITQITGATSYTIQATSNATSSVTNGGAVPVFTTVSASSIIEVTLNNHGVVTGNEISFAIPTTGNGVTIDGVYPVVSVVNANNFNIQIPTQATASGSFSMNGGNAQLLYYIALGPPPAGVGYGLGGYGLGGYGTGVVPPSQTGTPITSADWTTDNWGELVVGTPAGGGIYYWDPTGGFANMSLVSTGPIFNSGMFVSTSEQIMVTYGSCIGQTTQLGPSNVVIGVQQDPMLVQWSDSGDFTSWFPTEANFAGNFRIPIGSEIVAGIAGSANQNLIWTDLDLWAMNFIGQPDVFGFNQIGAGAGAASRHAVQKLRGALYWMGKSNFYIYDGSVRVIPCPVWDVVFQNFNTAFASNVCAMPNTPFDEAGWFYPSLSSINGENDSYVKFNIKEPGSPWDYGSLARSAWIDQSVLGNPIAATPSGVVYQHETTNDADGTPLVASMVSGYFYIAEGEDYVQVDQVLPDFKWGTFAGSQNAQIQLTFNVVNFPGQTPRTYGPYTVTQATTILWVRFRGRQVSITISSSDLGSFWRIGKIRFRYSTQGRQN